jgi:LysM repeat protein
MNSMTVTEGQSLLDIAIWLLGDAAAVFDLADANGLAITDAVQAGQVLVVPDSVAKPDVVKFLAEKGVVINTTNYVPDTPPVDTSLIDFDPTDFDDSDYY